MLRRLKTVQRRSGSKPAATPLASSAEPLLLRRLLVNPAQQRRRLRRNHIADHGARGVLLLRYVQQCDAVGTGLIDRSRHRSHVIGSRYAIHDVALLNAEFEITTCQKK